MVCFANDYSLGSSQQNTTDGFRNSQIRVRCWNDFLHSRAQIWLENDKAIARHPAGPIAELHAVADCGQKRFSVDTAQNFFAFFHSRFPPLVPFPEYGVSLTSPRQKQTPSSNAITRRPTAFF